MAPPEQHCLSIEVAYGSRDKVMVIPVQVAAGTTVLEAIRASGIQEHFPGLDPENRKLGIFGCLVDPGTVLEEGDRVEIYRPLQADPKAIRRRRAGRRSGSG